MNVQANTNAIWRDEYFRLVKNGVIPSLEPYGYNENDLDAYLSYQTMEEVLASEGNVIRYDLDSI